MRKLRTDSVMSQSHTSTSMTSNSNNISHTTTNSSFTSILGIRLGVLFILVIQNCSLILIMRYSRLIGDDNSRYIISTAVIISEFLKLLISLVVTYSVQLLTPSLWTFQTISTIYSNDYYKNRLEILKLCLPSCLYVIQNNLQYLSATYLPVSIFQILSQLKIVTTAIFSVIMLRNKHLSLQQWLSIIALTCGVGIVQYSNQHTSTTGTTTTTTTSNNSNQQDDHQHYIIGVICVLFSCITSGFSGVYFEKVLKSGGLSLWMRNTHLSLIGLILSGALCWYNDYDLIMNKGFFHGYNLIVWIVIFLQAGGGLIVASVVMYADNVLKGFATSFSVILSCIISSWFMETTSMNPLFIFGAGIVVSSAFIYSLYPAKSVAPSIPDPIQGKLRSNVSDERLNHRDNLDIENRDSK